jgi:hypothetical protein
MEINVLKVEKASFCSCGPIRLVEETHVSLKGKPFVLEAEASTTLFPC